MSAQHSVRGAASGWKEPGWGGGREGKEGEPGLGGLRAAAPSEATVAGGPLESVSGTSGDGGPGVRQPSAPGAGAVRGRGGERGSVWGRLGAETAPRAVRGGVARPPPCRTAEVLRQEGRGGRGLPPSLRKTRSLPLCLKLVTLGFRVPRTSEISAVRLFTFKTGGLLCWTQIAFGEVTIP